MTVEEIYTKIGQKTLEFISENDWKEVAIKIM